MLISLNLNAEYTEVSVLSRYSMNKEGFFWHAYSRSPEEAEVYFRYDLAVLMRLSVSKRTRSRAAKALRLKSLDIVKDG